MVSHLTQTEEDEEDNLKAIAVGVIQRPSTWHPCHIATDSACTATGFNAVNIALRSKEISGRVYPLLPQLDIQVYHFAMFGGYSNFIYPCHGSLSLAPAWNLIKYVFTKPGVCLTDCLHHTK